MFNISDFLEKFCKNISTQESQTKAICDVVFKHTGIIIDKNKIKIQNAILYLQISPAQKSKIYIFKQNIIKELIDIYKIKLLNIF